MLRIGAIVLNVPDTRAGAAFWRQALRYEHAANRDFLVVPDGAGPRLHLDDEDRMHLDLWTDSAAEQRAEVERLISLGATRVEREYPDDADFVVLADPFGNLFCIIDTSA